MTRFMKWLTLTMSCALFVASAISPFLLHGKHMLPYYGLMLSAAVALAWVSSVLKELE